MSVFAPKFKGFQPEGEAQTCSPVLPQFSFFSGRARPPPALQGLMGRLIFEEETKSLDKEGWGGGDGDGGGWGVIPDGCHSSHLLPHMFTPLFPAWPALGWWSSDSYFSDHCDHHHHYHHNHHYLFNQLSIYKDLKIKNTAAEFRGPCDCKC